MKYPPSCGTRSGYVTHSKLKTPKCEPCMVANQEYLASYRAKNAQKLADYSARWQRENPDKVNANSRKWRKNNPEKRKEVVRAYWAANPDKRREAVRRRRAIRKSLPIDKYTDQQVLDAYGTNCHICKNPIDLLASRRSGLGEWENGLHIDHLVPICNNGADTLDNVRPAHGKCNVSRNKREINKITNKEQERNNGYQTKDDWKIHQVC